MSFDIIVPASTLQDYVDTLTPIVDEASLAFHEDRVHTNPVDPANVCMVAETLHADACEHYEVHDEMTVGVNLMRLDDYLSKADSDDLVNLTFDGETRRIGIDYGDVSIDMAAIDPDSVRDGDTLPQNAIDMMTTDVCMEGAAFNHAIDVCGMASDHVTIDADPDREDPLHITAEGDTDDVSLEFSNALQEGSEIGTAAKSLFSEDYLADMAKVIPKTADIRLQHGHECPLRIQYELPDTVGTVEVEFGLAPRIKSN